jgi:ribosomal protein S15P/S13E
LKDKTMTHKLTYYHLRAEAVNDEHEQAILLTQQNGIEEPHSVLAHPWQLRAVCEQFSIVATDLQAHKTILMLTRRLQALADRAHFLADYLATHSDHKHADLSYETTYARATSDIAYEFCAELEDAQTPTEPLNEALQPVEPLADVDPRQLSIEA